MNENKKNILTALGFGEEVKREEKGLCVFCSKPVVWEDFKDEISKKEFRISGICQECQDKTFVKP